jgi:hypothetical protein
MRFGRAAIIVLSSSVVLGTLGCATLTDQKVMFKDTQRRYTRLMRFTDFDKARAFVAADSKEEFRETTDALGNLRITDYEIEEFESDGKVGTATVQYSGFRPTSPTVVTLSEEQHWELVGNTWTVRSTLAENTQ